MKPPSWDTSVFVPNSSRIAALIAPGWSRRRAPPLPHHHTTHEADGLTNTTPSSKEAPPESVRGKA